MSGFKLIAIRPLVGCDESFLKNLKPGQIYKLYNNIFFKDIEGEIIDIINENNIKSEIKSITYDNEKNIDLYSFNNESRKVNVNISAILGNNGSGKSALTEILLLALFFVSQKLRYVKKDNFITTQLEEANYSQDLKKIRNSFNVEIYYEQNGILRILQIQNNNFFLSNYPLEKKEIIIEEKNKILVTRREQIDDFFYSMIINYSIYSFNSNEIGIWLKSIFHKNDGYQMPVVINPYRNEGKIDINNEKYLTRSRLLSNLISINDYKEIDEELIVDEITFFRDEFKFDKILSIKENEFNKSKFSNKFIDKFRSEIILKLFSKYFDVKIRRKLYKKDYPEIGKLSNQDIYAIVEVYLIDKLISITTKYDNFFEFDRRKDKKNIIQDNFNIEELEIDDFVNKIYQDRSHVTLKIRQAIFFLGCNIFEIERQVPGFVIDFDKMVSKIDEIRSEYFFTDLIDFLPPPVFFSEISFTNGSKFNNLSSGQRQNIFTLNSIIYHLKNIDSVSKNKLKGSKLKSYTSINLILDEIELYFHPQFQQNFIFELLRLLKSSKLEFIENINLIFLTHSPFILSDIPNSNVLKLKNGNPQEFNEFENTFGANINDLLANDFFLGNGLIGNFAKDKIQDVIDYINYWDKKRENQNFIDSELESKLGWIESKQIAKKVIEQIGEPYLYEKLNDMFLDAFPDFRSEEIKRLKERIKQLEE